MLRILVQWFRDLHVQQGLDSSPESHVALRQPRPDQKVIAPILIIFRDPVSGLNRVLWEKWRAIAPLCIREQIFIWFEVPDDKSQWDIVQEALIAIPNVRMLYWLSGSMIPVVPASTLWSHDQLRMYIDKRNSFKPRNQWTQEHWIAHDVRWGIPGDMLRALREAKIKGQEPPELQTLRDEEPFETRETWEMGTLLRAAHRLPTDLDHIPKLFQIHYNPLEENQIVEWFDAHTPRAFKGEDSILVYRDKKTNKIVEVSILQQGQVPTERKKSRVERHDPKQNPDDQSEIVRLSLEETIGYEATQKMLFMAIVNLKDVFEAQKMIDTGMYDNRIRTLGVVGDGLEIKISTIPGAGGGLFATREFAKNEWVTFYDGRVISHEEAKELEKTPGAVSHVRKVSSMHSMIDGLRDAQLAMDENRGGGSFINDAKDVKNGNNAEWMTIDIEQVKKIMTSYTNTSLYTIMDKLSRAGGIVIIKALRVIPAGREIFVSYGSHYWSKPS